MKELLPWYVFDQNHVSSCLYSVLKSIFVCMCELCEDFPNYSAALTAGRTIGWVITENN